MPILEYIVWVLLGFLIGVSAGAPFSYGVLIRSNSKRSLKELPLALRLLYTYSDDSSKDSFRYPELWSFIIIAAGEIYVGSTLLDFNSDEEAIIFNSGIFGTVLLAMTATLFWWIVSLFGTQLWLKHRWIPNNQTSDDASNIVDDRPDSEGT